MNARSCQAISAHRQRLAGQRCGRIVTFADGKEKRAPRWASLAGAGIDCALKTDCIWVNMWISSWQKATLIMETKRLERQIAFVREVDKLKRI